MENFFFVKQGGVAIKVIFTSVLYIKVNGNNLQIITAEQEYITRLSITHFLRMANVTTNLFCRIHKSFAVQLTEVKMFNKNIVVLQGKEIPIGRQYKKALLSALKNEGTELNKEIGTERIDLSILKFTN